MGYMLSSLGNLQIDDNVELYIFVVNGGWHGGLYDSIEKNFAQLARSIGPAAVIAKGFEEGLWSQEICQKYLGKDYQSLFDFLPALLLTDTHPDMLRDESLRLLIPLREAQDEFGDIEAFFRALSRFATTKDPEFIDRFKEQKDFIDEGLRIVDLKPNFMGIGVNLNALIERVRERWK